MIRWKPGLYYYPACRPGLPAGLGPPAHLQHLPPDGLEVQGVLRHLCGAHDPAGEAGGGGEAVD